MKFTLSLGQALCGYDIKVPNLSGGEKRVQGSEVVKPGDSIRIRGGGMPISKQQGQFGDLIITFDIRFPPKLTQEEKAVLWDILGRK
ncbi:MAG: hypothetical protein EZS28_031134 [Streblomastix strix]|uniref:Chaperone DnaJ C-terminal domain-containing protein n=1 Tax=Streblomastix strix TaxID=222440 RepID=A0A5J4USE4_9EUKA|nr:MAG: hypothetical protein EZS28_031134 [Streblomastix strix]